MNKLEAKLSIQRTSMRKAMLTLASALTLNLFFASASVAVDVPRKQTFKEIAAKANDRDSNVRAIALRALAAQAPESESDVDALKSIVRQGDHDVVDKARQSVRLLTPASSSLAPKFREMLGDKNESVQLVGIEAVGQLNDAASGAIILSLLKQQPRRSFLSAHLGGAKVENMEYSWEAANALAKFGYTDALDELISRDEILGMTSFGGPLVARFGRPALLKVIPIARGNSARKGGALSTIAYMRDEAAVPDLIGLLGDSDPLVIDAAVSGLGRMAIQSPEHRESARKALSPLIQHSDRNVRGAAYMALAGFDSEESFQTLMNALSTRNVDALDIFYAFMAHPNPRAIPYFKKFIENDGKKQPNVTAARQVAAEAIYRISGEKVPYVGLDKDMARYRAGAIGYPYDSRKRFSNTEK